MRLLFSFLPLIALVRAGDGATSALWQPPVGSKFQILLGTNLQLLDTQELLPADADIFDIDLFNTPTDIIKKLHQKGKKVICYFSAGSSESWRPDDHLFKAKDKGEQMREWKGERWLDIRSADVFEVVRKRIKLAAEKGCDGIDPDNTDAFNRNRKAGGFSKKLTKQDSITYVKKIAAEARTLNMSTGLKNTEELLPSVAEYVQFAVNEECASTADSDGCIPYINFLKSGKPVFHIEYAKYQVSTNGKDVKLSSTKTNLRMKSSTALGQLFCLETALSNKKIVSQEVRTSFSTVIKMLGLDGFVMYCDGSWAVTSSTKPNATQTNWRGKGDGST